MVIKRNLKLEIPRKGRRERNCAIKPRFRSLKTFPFHLHSLSSHGAELFRFTFLRVMLTNVFGFNLRLRVMERNAELSERATRTLISTPPPGGV